MYQDITLKCKDCGNDFVFTAGEQEFYAEKGFQNQPQRCKREMFETVCANCGGVAKVPFQPNSDKPVYCSTCYAALKAEQ